jgi:hypothetical protein
MPPLLDSRVGDPRAGLEGATAGLAVEGSRGCLIRGRHGTSRCLIRGWGIRGRDSRAGDPRRRRKPRGWKEAQEARDSRVGNARRRRKPR